MQFCAKKYRKYADNDQNAIEKQLNDDFQVYEYLNQNKLQGNNVEEYSKLYNTLLVAKSEKKKKYQSLHVNFIKMTDDKMDKLQESSIQKSELKHDFKEDYDQIRNKVFNQMEVKNNLRKQILQTKKSLVNLLIYFILQNFLKGDIGHFISRNLSAQILQNKISKVKIVADDQFKRVTMAYLKDKDEIKLRAEMQKKFGKKLQNVSIYEDSKLNRLKKTYLTSMIRKNQIHDKLNYIQKLRSAVIQSDDLAYQKTIINEKIIDTFSTFNKLKNIIQKVPIIESIYGNTAEQITKFSKWLRDSSNYEKSELKNYDYDEKDEQISSANEKLQSSVLTVTSAIKSPLTIIQSITIQQLDQFQNIFITEYERLNNQISRHVELSNLQMKKSNELAAIIEKFNTEIETIQLNICSEVAKKYVVNKAMRKDYYENIQKFTKTLKIIFFILQYIQKQVNYTNENNEQLNEKQQINEDSCMLFTVSGVKSQDNKIKKISFLGSNQNISSDKSILNSSKNFISELYTTYQFLVKDEYDKNTLNEGTFKTYNHLQSNLKKWFNIIKENIKNGSMKRRSDQINHFSHKKINELTTLSMYQRVSKKENQYFRAKGLQLQNQTEEDESKNDQEFNYENHIKNHTMHREQNVHHAQNKSFSVSSASGKKRTPLNRNQTNSANNSFSNIVNLKKLRNSTESKEAIRIRLLKDLDKDYYKMLKSTLKMEKQNTRKNYNFLRTFKRAKYSSRDQILEEKRFQCSFSMLFTGKKPQEQKQEPLILNKKSNLFKSSHVDSKIKKSWKQSKVFESRVKYSKETKQNIRKVPTGKEQKIMKQNVEKFKESKRKLLGYLSCNKPFNNVI